MSTSIRTVAVVATPMARIEQRPSLSGTWKTGQIVTCDPGIWNGADLTFSYQWKRGGVDIAGATGATYTLLVADEGAKVSCAVSAKPKDGHYQPASAQSSQSPTIAAV